MSLPSVGTIRLFPGDGVAGWERATTAIGLRHAAIAKLGCQASLYIAEQHVARADLIGVLVEATAVVGCTPATSVVSLQHIAAIFRAVLCYLRGGAQNDFQFCWRKQTVRGGHGRTRRPNRDQCRH